MRVIAARNVHQALPQALYQLRLSGHKSDSRNGPVTVFPEPVTTVYMRPEERVIFWPERDANPFFHLFESIWMLAGRDDVEPVAEFVDNMRSFSDDGVRFNGAYGYRWREFFGKDQLLMIVEALKKDKTDRRQILQMWDASDLGKASKDLPCNIAVHFQYCAATDALDMTVWNRSNDIVWGAYGANAVHFSLLHEFVASAAGFKMGTYRQVSDNLHAYDATIGKVAELADKANHKFYGTISDAEYDPYLGLVTPYALHIPSPEFFLEQCGHAVDGNYERVQHPFLRDVLQPMSDAYLGYKNGMPIENCLKLLSHCKATDWQLAGEEWFERRLAKRRLEREKDDGVNYETN